MFLKIRCKSVGETAELSILCPDDEETRVPVKINLDEIDVQSNDEHSNTIDISDKIKIVLRYPTVKDVVDSVVLCVQPGSGDTIQFINGEIFLNNSKIPRKEITKSYNIRCGKLTFEVNAYKETLPNGESYIAVYRKDGTLKNTDLYTVPSGHYFFLGDTAAKCHNFV